MIEELGRGGMGVVYKALHIRLNRIVALKMILSGAHADSEERQRFQSEAQAIARLQHPGIVVIHEISEHNGKPFFSLEYCPDSLAKQLAGSPMQPQAAAKLIRQLCHGIQAAHEAYIVHRDLKPANVLLSADGTPKITDFGLAKKLDEQSQTHTGNVLGTPSYMSPEQAEGKKDIGPEVDIYALGAILYECLTGRPPFRAATAHDTMNQVMCKEPVSPRLLNGKVPKDLETICLKCLSKSPKGRYSSAQKLADDLGRYLSGEAILARPVGRLERATKWVKRNPVVSVAALIVALALSLGSTVSYLKYLDAEHQKDNAEYQKDIAQQKQKEAEEQSDIAEKRRKEAEEQSNIAEKRRKEAEEQTQTAMAVSQFLGGIFAEVDPVARTGRMFGARKNEEATLTALDIVNRGAAQLKTSLLDKPRIRASLLDRIGNVYLSLNRTKDAEPLLREALELRRKEFGEDHLEFAASLQSIGVLHMSRAEMIEACRVLEQALALRRKHLGEKHLGEKHLLVADTLFHLGTQRVLLWDFQEAERLLQECLAIRRTQLGKENREVCGTLLVLGQMYLSNNELFKAAPVLNEAAATLDKIEGNNDFSSLLALYSQAQLAAGLGDSKRARMLFEEVDAKAVKLFGEDHYLLSICRGQFAHFLMEQGDVDKALKLFRSQVEVFRKSFGPDAYPVAEALSHLTRAERAKGNLAETEAALRESARIRRKVLAADTRPRAEHTRRAEGAAQCLGALGLVVLARGDLREADTVFRDSLVFQLSYPQLNPMWAAKHLARTLLQREKNAVSENFMEHQQPLSKSKDDFELARTWGKAAGALTRLSQPLSADDKLILEYFQKQAVSLLRSAAANGMRDANVLQSNVDFEPLSGNAGFRELLGELKQSATQMK